MATGRESRADRLNERLRGAQRTNVGDDSFNLDIAGIAAPQPPSPRPVSTAKRRKIDHDARSVASQDLGTADPIPAPPRSDPYDLPVTSRESDGLGEPSRQRQSSAQSGSSSRSVPLSSVLRSSPSNPGQDRDELDDLPVQPNSTLPAVTSSPLRSRRGVPVDDEVEESPAHAPGSGQRRKVRLSSALGSSARMQSSLINAGNTAPASSSPLARKARRSSAAPSMRATRRSAISRDSQSADVDELSPGRPQEDTAAEGQEGSVVELQPAEDPTSTRSQGHAEPQSDEAAEEINETQAAKTIGRRRPRRSKSLELGAGAVEDQAGESDDQQPVKRGGRLGKSPATQRAPVPKAKAKPKKHVPGKKRPADNRSNDNEDEASNTNRTGDGEDNTIEITVQRFINNKSRNDDDDIADPLHAEIPFANRTGESVVDVFAQVCEEVIATTADQFRQLAVNAADTAKKKEYRIKLRALEAYREELSSRLLQHTIHLNHWHSLRKRIRHVQREKLSLREEILRLKGEREQVALRMDAVRMKHEADNKDSTYRLSTSSLMHDIDLAVEQGRQAPELSRTAQKQADLANLELLVSTVAEEASSTSATGGMLSQVKSFNAFLERAAAALESK